MISLAKEKQSSTFAEVSWRNKVTLQIKNEKVRLFLLKVQEYEKQVEVKNIKSNINLLSFFRKSF